MLVHIYIIWASNVSTFKHFLQDTSLSYQIALFCYNSIKLWIKPKLHVVMVNITQMVPKLGHLIVLCYQINIMALIAL